MNSGEFMDSKLDLVSIIVPAYNVEKYIGLTIESVLKQTYDNWELIIIDDCSEDSTAEIAESYSEKDERIHFYKNSTNSGVAATRNYGFTLAKGSWIALLDSDDKWYENKLERQLEIAKRDNADILYSSYLLVNQKTGKSKAYIVPESTDYKRMLRENIIGCSTVILKKEITDNFQFNSEFAHEDYALWLRILKAGYKAAGCSEILVDYSILENSRSFNKWKAAKNRWKVFREGQQLPLYRAIPAFCIYAVKGVIKYG